MIYFYEIVLKDNTIVCFISMVKDYKVAYLEYCISNRIIPQSITNHEKWASKTMSKYRRSCAAQSFSVDFSINYKEIEKI